MPSCCSTRAASMPSQVEATLINTRCSVSMPSARYNAAMRLPRAMVPAVSNDSRASTSVDTRPGISDRICVPKRTSRRSITSSRGLP